MATRTFTIPASQIYIDSDNEKHTITTSENFTLTLDDTGDGGNYYGGGTNSNIACADGFKLNIELDARFTYFAVTADGATKKPGSITFLEDGYARVIWDIRTLTLTDADGTGENNLASITLERRDNPMVSITWTNVTMA